MEFSPEMIAEWTSTAIVWGLLVLKAIVVMAIGWIVANMAYSRVIKVVQSRELDMSLGRFLAQLARWGIIAATVMAALQVFEVEVMGFVALFASAGVAVGLALQGNLSNFASGVMILIFRPFDIGDVITAAGATGAVEEIGLFATTVITPDNLKIIIPNSGVTGGVITNITTRGTRRAGIPVGVAYGSDATKVMELLQRAAASVPEVLEDPAPAVGFVGLGDSSIDFNVLVWSKSGDWIPAQGAVRLACYNALNEAGIDIPYPQMVVHKADA